MAALPTVRKAKAKPRAAPKPASLPKGLVTAVAEASFVKVRAGLGKHEFRAIWAVVVESRVFVRSWSLKPDGWYHTFLKEPRGALQVGKQQADVQAVKTTSERLKDAVSQAYLDKYDSPSSKPYARGLGEPRSRATTTELTPR